MISFEQAPNLARFTNLIFGEFSAIFRKSWGSDSKAQCFEKINITFTTEIPVNGTLL